MYADVQLFYMNDRLVSVLLQAVVIPIIEVGASLARQVLRLLFLLADDLYQGVVVCGSVYYQVFVRLRSFVVLR